MGRCRRGLAPLAALLLGARGVRVVPKSGVDDIAALVQHAIKGSQHRGGEVTNSSLNGSHEAQYLPASTSPSGTYELGEAVDVEVLEGIPGSYMKSIITGKGDVPGTYNVEVVSAPPEHRFMENVSPSLMRRRTASVKVARLPENGLQLMGRTTEAQEAQEVASGGRAPFGGLPGALFSALDGNTDGSISRAELGRALADVASWASGSKPLPPVARTQLEAALPKGEECWKSGYSYGSCCDLQFGPAGDPNCWDAVFTFQRCCAPEQQAEARRPGAAAELALRAAGKQQQEELKSAQEARAKATEAERKAAELQERRAKAQAKREAEEEAKAKARAEARQRAAEARQRKAEEEAKHKAEEEVRLAWERLACPPGFQYFSGDAPGQDQFGHADKRKRPNVEQCGKECSKNPRCRSFEWSPTKLQCNMNRVAEPKLAKNADFVFCKRHAE